MTEKAIGPQDLFIRQMLLTGHRVPILFDIGGGKIAMDHLHDEVGAHVGGLTSGDSSFLNTTTSLEQAFSLPFALQHFVCAKGVDSCNSNEYKYNARCWVDRVDVDPPTAQDNKYGSQGSY